MKLKRQTRTVYRTYDGERYIFRNGVAKVPGYNIFRGKPMRVTLKEFDEIVDELTDKQSKEV